MKKLIPVIFLLLLGTSVLAQNHHEVITENSGEKIFKGFLTREAVQNDTSFKWYAENLKGYTPHAGAIEGLKKNADSIQLLTFLGTWCSDSRFIIPKFFALTDAAGFSQDKITLIGVDRAKKTHGHLTEALNIKNVPTIIVLKNGIEMGRVVEYGKYGVFDKELGEILNSIK